MSCIFNFFGELKPLSGSLPSQFSHSNLIKKMRDEEQSETSNLSNFRLCSLIKSGNGSLMECLSKIVQCFLINMLSPKC